MNNDLISREALIKAVEDLYEYAELGEVLDVIKEAPAVELTETEIQEVLNKRCMSAVANEFLIALHGKRPHGKWEEPFEMNGKTYHKCTHCHISSELILFGNFCPNCGADMRGEEE